MVIFRLSEDSSNLLLKIYLTFVVFFFIRQSNTNIYLHFGLQIGKYLLFVTCTVIAKMFSMKYSGLRETTQLTKLLLLILLQQAYHLQFVVLTYHKCFFAFAKTFVKFQLWQVRNLRNKRSRYKYHKRVVWWVYMQRLTPLYLNTVIVDRRAPFCCASCIFSGFLFFPFFS